MAEGFAEEREWDLVEVVARRTIDGEGGLDAGLKDGGVSVSGRYLPINAWAWKAVGVVELVSRRTLKQRTILLIPPHLDPSKISSGNRSISNST